MGPDMQNRVRSVLITMILWTVFSILVIVVFPFYWTLFVVGGLGVFFSAWSGLYLMKNRKQPAVISRMLLAGSGVLVAWGALMFVASPLLWPFLPDGFDLWSGTYPHMGGLSFGVNIVLTMILMVLPIFLQRIKPGEYFLVSTLGQSDPPYVIRHAELSSGVQASSAANNPGSLIGKGKQLWIRPVDTARLIWNSTETVLYDDNILGLLSSDNQNVDLHVTLTFKFDPRQVSVPDFALQLQEVRSIKEVKALLQRIVKDEIHQTLWSYINRLPYDVASSAEIIKQMPTLLKQRMNMTENQLGLPLDVSKSSVEILAAPIVAQIAVQSPDWQYENRQRVQDMTAGAERGDPISRLLLFLYLFDHPEIRMRILPNSREQLRISDVDFLLTEMNRDPSFQEDLVGIMLEGFNNNMALPTASAGSLPSGAIEGPDIRLGCTARGTVAIMWSALDGELYLHWDGQQAGPFYDRNGQVDTMQQTVQQAEYTWNRDAYMLGYFSCQQSVSPPPPSPQPPHAAQQSSPPPIRRRQFGPSLDDTVDTRRNKDGTYEPD